MATQEGCFNTLGHLLALDPQMTRTGVRTSLFPMSAVKGSATSTCPTRSESHLPPEHYPQAPCPYRRASRDCVPDHMCCLPYHLCGPDRQMPRETDEGARESCGVRRLCQLGTGQACMEPPPPCGLGKCQNARAAIPSLPQAHSI